MSILCLSLSSLVSSTPFPRLMGHHHPSCPPAPSPPRHAPAPPPLPVLSPQICIKASSQGLKLLYLLTCSSLSQVKCQPQPPLPLGPQPQSAPLTPFLSQAPPPFLKCLACFIGDPLFHRRLPVCLSVCRCLHFFSYTVINTFLFYHVLCSDVSQNQGGDTKRKNLWHNWTPDSSSSSRRKRSLQCLGATSQRKNPAVAAPTRSHRREVDLRFWTQTQASDVCRLCVCVFECVCVFLTIW